MMVFRQIGQQHARQTQITTIREVDEIDVRGVGECRYFLCSCSCQEYLLRRLPPQYGRAARLPWPKPRWGNIGEEGSGNWLVRKRRPTNPGLEFELGTWC